MHQTDVVRLPDGADPTTAAIGPLGAIAYQGVVTSNIQPGSRVLVAGLGAIGQFSALWSRLRGAEVWAMDPVAARRELAARISKVKSSIPAMTSRRRIEETAWGIQAVARAEQPTEARYEQRRWAGLPGWWTWSSTPPGAATRSRRT